jgi:hypothetical protein
MNRGGLILAIFLSAVVAQGANAAGAKKKAEPEDLNANGKKLVMDGLPLVMPSAVMYYMLYQKQVEAQHAAKTKGSKPRPRSARHKRRLFVGPHERLQQRAPDGRLPRGGGDLRPQ